MDQTWAAEACFVDGECHLSEGKGAGACAGGDLVWPLCVALALLLILDRAWALSSRSRTMQILS